LTIAPDNKTAYVANSHTNNVSVVDIASMKEVALIPVGFARRGTLPGSPRR
jgi:YVTN family beta-propeller protein